MKKILLYFFSVLCVAGCRMGNHPGRTSHGTGDTLVFHEIRVDDEGKIVPWNFDDPGEAYDDILDRLWTFWDTMRVNMNGLPDYMNHLVWFPDHYTDRGIAGDQIAMCLSSWDLLYQYTGNDRVQENMQFMAGYYLTHSLSPSDCLWPDIPFPQNTQLYSGIYDGDMIIGKGYIQPDKAASFAYELLKMAFRMPRDPHVGDYLNSAIKIANTLARNIRPGDEDHSPWPFKVNAFTGEVGTLKDSYFCEYRDHLGFVYDYTTNYTSALDLFLKLSEMGVGNPDLYREVAGQLLDWMLAYPVRNNKWGLFFEDVPGWSDTQTNAVTFAQFLMNHPELDEDWKEHARSALDWAWNTLKNEGWKQYGVEVMCEQTAFRIPGNSHTARQACAEIQYTRMTGDSTRFENAVRALNWATYMVNESGWNCYYTDGEIWYSDGYGDYVRHYLRAMASCPDLAPAEEHILSSTSGIKKVDYSDHDCSYRAALPSGVEVIRLACRPDSVIIPRVCMRVPEGPAPDAPAFWEWVDCKKGGALIVTRRDAEEIDIY